MTVKNKEIFTVTIDGKEVELAVVKPQRTQYQSAQVHYNTTFAGLLRGDALVRPELDNYMRKKGLWDDARQNQYDDLVEKIRNGELTLKKGGIKVTDGKELALKIRQWREESRELASERSSLDTHTAEGQAENARFNYLVAQCLVYNDSGKPVYSGLDEYLEHAADEAANQGARRFAAMFYGYDSDFEANLPENKFLRRFKFVDDELRFIDKTGRLIDEDGRLIDEDGRYIDENGNYVDKHGRPVDKDGEFICEPQPFLDEDGNPIEE